MKKFTLDARNMPCPRPLLMTKEALEKGGFTHLEIRLNNRAARENVLRYLAKTGYGNIDCPEQADGQGEWLLSLEVGVGAVLPAGEPEGELTLPVSNGGTLLLGVDRIGRGDDTLGALLMKGFIYTLSQRESAPANLILMNSGVRLACEDSESLNDLAVLEGKGCRLLVCGTCLDYLKLSEKRRAGTVSNMYEITSVLMENPDTITMT